MKIEIQLSEKQINEIVRQILICMPVKEIDNIKDKVIILRRRGMSTRVIGKILNISRQTVLNWDK